MLRPHTVPDDHKDFQVGDQAHICLHTDIEPYTVIERKGKRIKLQKAKATLDGDFLGKSINNSNQKWIITENPDGKIIEGFLGINNEWYEKGNNRLTTIEIGYVKFHDFNY
tara:strand:- start:241 stop:573 length:333 start_codon:yes stop_codon:yes gene_type:complete